MALEFVGDAISLSGLTGSKIKSEIISQYYPFWWNITSGGPNANHEWKTSIVELNAATGEMYIKDTKETVLGSAGHALDLKLSNTATKNLKIILVEEDEECYSHLKRVISRRWPHVNVASTEGSFHRNRTNIHLINENIDNAIDKIGRLNLGNSLFFFDPLRSVPFNTIEKVAMARIRKYYQTGTEFIIFVFTSDWFLGRDDFSGLPKSLDENEWNASEKVTIMEADELFGNIGWRSIILNNDPLHVREMNFIELYKHELHKWFRYVLPMPFNPKGNQIYHLLLCSNFETGVRATRKFFCEITHNLDYKPDNKQAYIYFSARHPDLLKGMARNRRPKQWHILWHTITQHEEGICDCMCRDVEAVEKDPVEREILIEWLVNEGYFVVYRENNPWDLPIIQYMIDWELVKRYLGVSPPKDLEPLSLRPTSLWELSQ